MKSKFYLLLTFFVFASSSSFSQGFYQSSLNIRATQGQWKNYEGYFSDFVMELTPENNFARVDMTFTVNIDSTKNYPYHSKPTYKENDLEAWLYFSLPSSESYFYDSYLWLNDNDIIRAELMERGEANRVYDSIVDRRVDPSILQKSYNNVYSLNIYPISTAFKRKVKLSYSMAIENNQIEFPHALTSFIKPSSTFQLKVNKNETSKYSQILYVTSPKKLQETNAYSLYEINENAISTSSKISIENVISSPFIFKYQTTNNDEGFYEIKINPNRLPNFTENTSKFNIDIPFLNSGFSYNEVSGANTKLSLESNYYEAGKFYGDIDFSKSIILRYIINGTTHTFTTPISANNIGKYINQNWAHYYCENNASADEAMELSIENRVLTLKTAFLALEDGDTVSSTNYDDNYDVTGVNGNAGTVSITSNSQSSDISIYPNPFVNFINIKSENNISSIRIMNITGELVYEESIVGFKKEIKIDASDLNLTQGIYFLMIETDSGVETVRILKNL